MRSIIKERRYECEDNVTWELEDWLCQTIKDCFAYINYDTFNPNEIQSETLNQRVRKDSQVRGTICGILSATNLC